MATNTEYLKTLITVAGGDASSLPDNLESTHYKALIEAHTNGTGGGGASDENWRKIAEHTFGEDLENTWCYVDEDENGNPLKLSKFLLIIKATSLVNNGFYVQAYKKNGWNANYIVAIGKFNGTINCAILCENINDKILRTTYCVNTVINTPSGTIGLKTLDMPIEGISIYFENSFSAGANYEVWGVDK